MNGVPMKIDYSKTINEQLPTFNYYKDRYISYELELIKLRKENEKLQHYKTLYQSLKRQKEELRSWLEEQEEKAWDEVSSTFGYVLDKLEELERVNNE